MSVWDSESDAAPAAPTTAIGMAAIANAGLIAKATSPAPNSTPVVRSPRPVPARGPSRMITSSANDATHRADGVHQAVGVGSCPEHVAREHRHEGDAREAQDLDDDDHEREHPQHPVTPQEGQ